MSGLMFLLLVKKINVFFFIQYGKMYTQYIVNNDVVLF